MKKTKSENVQMSAGIDQVTLERLAHLLGICLYKLDLETRDISLTVNTTSLTGYNYDELPRNDDSKGSMIYEDDRDLVNQSIASIISGQKDHYHIEYRMRRKDSSIVWIEEVGIVSARDAEGKPLYMSAMAQDLSRLKWAEEKARGMESEARKLSLSGTGTGDGSTLADENRLLRAGNAAAARIIGGFHQEYEVVLRQSIQMLGESLQADYAGIWRNVEKDGAVGCFLRACWTQKAHAAEAEAEEKFFKYDVIFPKWKEKLTDHSYVIMPGGGFSKKFTDDCGMSAAGHKLFVPLYLHGDFWGMVGFSRAGSPFAAYEAETAGSSAIIIACSVSRNETFGKINSDRDKAIADTLAKGEFLSRMSHELRTPLNAIIGMTSIALKEKDPERITDHIKKVETSSQLLLNIINDILDMSKIEAGKLDLVNEPFDFYGMIRNAENIVRVNMEGKQQRFTVTCDDGLTEKILSDEHRLLQVVVNLLSNATKFTPEHGEISLVATQRKVSDDHVKLRVEVRDNGIGMSMEQQEKLFHAFEQGDGGITRKYGGTGLGLAICKKILNGLGGDIWVKSKPNQGACFFFELEAKLGEPLDSAKAVSAASEDENIKPDWSAFTILVAEDVDINREIVEIMLEDSGVKIESVENGQEAVDRFCAAPERYKLILMDIQMPVMDGLAATRAIRAAHRPNAKTIPIVAMTANAFKEDVEACLAAGMNWHIAKPIIPWQFYSVLRKFLK